MTGLLIINADDWGITAPTTDAIASCFRQGAISSATGMVWMADSERAATIAREEGWPIGLHLNLIEPFTDSRVPERVAATQRRVVERLRGAGTGAQLYHPSWRGDFEQTIADQLARFHESYGRAPTHVDGHQHMHLALNALLARALSPVGRCRRPFSLRASEATPARRAVRAVLAALVRLRFTTTDRFVSVRALSPRLGARADADGLARAAQQSIEVMVHPGWDDEFALLTSAEWRSQVEPHRLGSFADL